MKGAGICLVTPEGKILFLLRSPGPDHGGEWDFPGGGVEEGETLEQAARREMGEEIGFSSDAPVRMLSSFDVVGGVDFTTFLMEVDKEIKPALLKSEHTEYKWSPADDPPQPLHPGVKKTLGEYMRKRKLAADAMAMDRSSVRTMDQDGRLHVERSHITKANICPYMGKEIPGSEELGLDDEKIYKLLRDPEELQKAAPSLNNIQLLIKHTPVNSKDTQKDLVVGSTGTDAEWNPPYLDNSLVVWDEEAIRGIESEKQKELSAGYHYDADMTPGTYEGEAYDGVMRNIRFNHVALVVDGRAGKDVVVGDSALNVNFNKETDNMSIKKSKPSFAAMVLGALTAAVSPRLAQDAKVDLSGMTANVKGNNYGASKKKIVAAIQALPEKTFKSKQAMDEAAEELVKLLDALEGEAPTEDEDSDANLEGSEVKEKTDGQDSPNAAVLSMLKEKLSPEEYAEVEKMLAPAADADLESPEDRLEDKKIEQMLMALMEKLGVQMPAMDKEVDDVGKGKKPEIGEAGVSKPAMDAAIREAKAAAEKSTIQRLNAISEAREVVRPHIGDVKMAVDSAESLYRLALDNAGIDLEGVHPSAFKAMVQMLPKEGDRQMSHVPTLGMDSKHVGGFQERFGKRTVRQLG